MEGLPTRSSEISPFFSSKQNWESQASNISGGPAEGQMLMVSSLGLGKEHWAYRTYLSLDLDNEESLWAFSKPFGPKWGIKQGEEVYRPYWDQSVAAK